MRRTVEAAGDGEPPLEVPQPGKRPHQNVVALARRDRADGKEPHRRAGAFRARRRLGPGLGDAEPVRGDIEIGRKQARREAARGDDVLRLGKRFAFGAKKRVPPLRREPALEAERMVHERDRRARQAPDESRRHSAVGEPVDEVQRPPARGQEPLRFGKLVRARMRKPARQADSA